MKKLMILLVTLTIVGFTAQETTLTDAERLVAMTEMTASHDHFFETIKGLNEAQLNFKSSPESWSIAECAEHIAISEGSFFNMIQGTLKKPADPSRRAEVKMTDEQVLAMSADRSKKVKTQEPFEPTGKFGSYDATIKDFKTKRIDNIRYIANTQDDLRNHYAEFPFGILDSYQVFLFMSGHTDRHILQMKEIMAHKNFPK
jgi:hypothetical protein